MKKIITIFQTLILFNLLSNAQPVYFEWAKQLGEAAGYEVGTDIRVDDAGNAYTVGYFQGTVDFDPGPGVFTLTAQGTEAFVSKLNAAGNHVWTIQIKGTNQFGSGSYGYAITFDADGNIYFTGSFAGTVDFDPGPQTNYITGPSSLTTFTCKLSASGNLIWAVQLIESINSTFLSSGRSIAVDDAGDVYISGFVNGIADFDPGPGTLILGSYYNCREVFISKLSSSGNLIWAKTTQSAANEMGWIDISRNISMTLDAAGNVYVKGSFFGLVDFDPGPGVNTLYRDWGDVVFILKLNSSGNFVWVRQLGYGADASTSFGHTIGSDASGNVYITGYFTGTVDFDPGSGIYNMSSSNQSGFVLKMDASGNFVWARQFSGDQFAEVYSVRFDIAGNIYLTGIFSGTIDFDPGAGTSPVTSTGFKDVFVCRLNTSADFAWAYHMGGTRIAEGLASAVDVSGNVYTTGFFEETTDFDPGTDVYNLTSYGSYDAFVHKMSHCNGNTYNEVIASSCGSYSFNGQTFTATGVYTQLLTNSVGCDSIITIYFNNNRTYSNQLITACGNYVWNGLSYASSGTYSDTLVGVNGCDSIVTLSLIINPVSFSFVDTSICEGDSFESYTATGNYSDTLTAANGCDSIRVIKLLVKTNCNYFNIPGVFTPDNNGINDVFRPLFSQVVRQYRFAVYNRFGQKMYETNDPLGGWNGYYNGVLQPMGTYVYEVFMINAEGKIYRRNGAVVLFR